MTSGSVGSLELVVEVKVDDFVRIDGGVDASNFSLRVVKADGVNGGSGGVLKEAEARAEEGCRGGEGDGRTCDYKHCSASTAPQVTRTSNFRCTMTSPSGPGTQTTMVASKAVAAAPTTPREIGIRRLSVADVVADVEASNTRPLCHK